MAGRVRRICAALAVLAALTTANSATQVVAASTGTSPASSRAQARFHPSVPTFRPLGAGPRQPVSVVATRPSLSTAHGGPAMPAVIRDFPGQAGSTFGCNAATPPDPIGAVGPNNYVQAVNGSIEVWNKSGAVVSAPKCTYTLWANYTGTNPGNGCKNNNDGDPMVRYDQMADRWVISQFSLPNVNSNTGPSFQCVAVSQTGDPTGAYNLYDFQYNAYINDYPKLGVWPDAYYFSYNLFSPTTFLGVEMCALNRAAMLAGLSATQKCFQTSSSYFTALPANVDGSIPPPSGSPEYFVSEDFTDANGNGNTLDLWRFHVDWANLSNSTLSGPAAVTTAAFTDGCAPSFSNCIPELGGDPLDAKGGFLMDRLAYRNFGDHESLVVNHSVNAGSSTGVRWYELRVAGASASVYQQGTYAPDANYRWMGSIAQDQAGDMALGFSLSSSSTHPAIALTGRLASDSLGQMPQGETIVATGPGSESGAGRWGDYTSMTVDPSDDCTFWYTSEYYPTTGEFIWQTQIMSFKFPSCRANDFSISANPSSVSASQGSSGSTSISTSATVGLPETVALNASGLPAGATASFAPASVTAGQSSTLTLSAGAATPIGTYQVTVSGTAPSAHHATTVAFTVTAGAPNDFSISANPSSLTLAQGTSGTSSIDTAVVSGSAATVSLVASAPNGITATLNPTSVTAGNSSTLTVAVDPSVAPNTYQVTVTGTEGSASHGTQVSVIVTAAPNDFSITSNPGSLTLVQGTSGTSSIDTAVLSGSAGTVGLVASAPSGITATLNPTSVTAGSSSTLTVAVDASVAPNTYQVTITGTEGSASHSTQVSVTVTAAAGNDFSITSNPNSLTLLQGTSATASIGTFVVTGSAGTVAISATAPAGLAAGLSPTSVTAGNSSTLTVGAGLSLAPGTYTVTVTGTEGSVSHQTTVSVIVQVQPVTNGGFETGNLSGWTQTGTVSIARTAHGGTYSARVGSTSPSSTSTLAQPINVPSVGGKLTFWYRMTCPDTVTNDWFTVTLRDNVTGRNFVILRPTCAAHGFWRQVAFDATVAAGHSVALTFTNHDDGGAGTSSFTLVDDVLISLPPPPGPGVIFNGDFEFGNLNGWVATGKVSVVGSSHTGAFAAQAGSTTPSSTSTLSQTFIVPSGGGTLTFWYQIRCPDTVANDWFTVSLRDNSNGTNQVLLANTCTNNGGWQQLTSGLGTQAGHSLTLTFVNHDDGFTSDPTYTLVDDVTIQ